MTFETAADRQIFVRDFGERVVFRGASIGYKAVTCIFDNDYASVQGETVEFATVVPMLTCVTDDVDGVAFGDTAEVRRKTYKVVNVMANGTGITELMLELQ